MVGKLNFFSIQLLVSNSSFCLYLTKKLNSDFQSIFILYSFVREP